MSTAAATHPGDDLIPVLQPAEWFGADLALVERPLVRASGAAARGPTPRLVLAWEDDDVLLFPQPWQLEPHDWEDLAETARANLRRRHPPRWHYRGDGGGQLCLGLLEGRFAASYAADRRVLQRAHARFGLSRLLLAVPGHDKLLVTSGHAFAADPFAELTEGLYGLADSPISRRVFLSIDGRVAGPLEIPGRR